MQALTTTGKLFKQFIQFLQEQGYQVFWHDINPEEREYVDVTCNGEHLMPAGVPTIPNDGIVVIDDFATIYLEQGKGGRKMQRVFKDWQAGKMFLGSTKLSPPHLVAHYERIITAAVAMNGEEKAQLADWVGRHVKPDNELATSDWPGWKGVISRVIG